MGGYTVNHTFKGEMNQISGAFLKNFGVGLAFWSQQEHKVAHHSYSSTKIPFSNIKRL